MKTQLKNFLLKIFTNSVLKNIQIFYLIVSVIAIMVFFLMIQGYMSINNIDAMQQVNQDLSNTSMRFARQVDDLKGNLLYIKENYLKRLSKLSDSSALTYTFRRIDSNLQDIELFRKLPFGADQYQIIARC